MAFIKIDKAIIDSYCFANPISLKIWLWLLLKANYKKSFMPYNVGKSTSTVEVNRGQLIFGRFKAEEELGIDGSMIYRNLKKFEELGQINITSNNHFSIITICKYDTYQDKKDNSEQQVNSRRTADEQQMNNRRTTDEQQMNTSKEEIEYIEYKEEIEETAFFEKFKNEFNMVVVEMYKVWQNKNPTYPKDTEKDYHVLLQFSYKIAEYKNLQKSSVVTFNEYKIIESWEKIADYILNDKWLCDKQLSTLLNQWQSIVIGMTKIKGKSQKSKFSFI